MLKISPLMRSLSLFDLLAFLKDYNIQPSLGGKHVRSGWVGLRCPFCGDDKDHLGFNLARNYFKCWRCGYHSIAETLRGILRLDWVEAYRLWEQYDTEEQKSPWREKKYTRAIRVELPREALSTREHRYLRHRGFDSDFLEKTYTLRSGGLAGYWRFRILIPLYFQGQLVSWTGRAIAEEMEPRYQNLKEEQSVLSTKETLYNIDTLWDLRDIIVVEGPTDVWRLGPGFVASLGTALSPRQYALLAQWKRVSFLFDNEEEAQRRARKHAEVLSSLGVPQVEILQSDRGKDPGALSEEEARTLREEIQIC